MNYKKIILEKLIDKFEERKEDSNRRVFIKCSKKEIEIPSTEDTDYQLFLHDMNELQSCEFIDFDWIRKGYIIDRIWLITDNSDKVYSYLKREPKNYRVNRILSGIKKALPSIHREWIRTGLKSEIEKMASEHKLYGIWKHDDELRENIFKAICYIDNLGDDSVSMRACSIYLYSDSKYFEREVKKYLVSWVKKYEPVIKESEVSEEREILAHIGIIMMPEIFEFCGSISVHFPDGTVDFSPIKTGSCISADCIKDIISIEFIGIKKVLFIENKTNYSEYCIKEKQEDELVIYHGGFYSPQHGEFFRKIYYSSKDIQMLFWADIDYGGIQMYQRLRRNIIPNLKPFRMDFSSYISLSYNGLKRSDSYLERLKELLNDSENEVFRDVIEAILSKKVTVEQESFLL